MPRRPAPLPGLLLGLCSACQPATPPPPTCPEPPRVDSALIAKEGDDAPSNDATVRPRSALPANCQAALQATVEITRMLTEAGGRATRSAACVDGPGTRIVVDDFGVGFTSLQYLHRFPVQKLKIDKSFIRNLNRDDRAREIARSIIQLCQELGIQVTAEGVEERYQLDALERWHCDEAQGFLFSQPIDGEAALQEWLEWRASGLPGERAANDR